MKTFDEILHQRRSIRHFDADTKIPQASIVQIIEAALEAPSWRNQQTSRYHVVSTPEILAQLKSSCLPPKNQITVADAPVLIVSTFVRGVVGFNADGCAENELGDGWGLYDLGLQNSILLLKAAELGLDTVVLGLRDADAIRNLLNIPSEEVIGAVIGVGLRTADAIRPARKSVADITKFY